jgi:hypothetical protein
MFVISVVVIVTGAKIRAVGIFMIIVVMRVLYMRGRRYMMRRSYMRGRRLQYSVTGDI